MPIDWRSLINAVVAQIAHAPSVEGAFLSGSLVNENRDAYADVDLGIASADSAAAFAAAWALRGPILAAAGEPLHHIERGWNHCQMVAALYGKAAFPPIGLEVDVVFSQLQHVGEQMPYAPYEVVHDRTGRLTTALARLPHQKPEAEFAQAIRGHLRGFPFCVHDALKAVGRGDFFDLQARLEGMRGAIFYAAAARYGREVYGTKRAYRHLSESERQVVDHSYHDRTAQSVYALADLFTRCLSDVPAAYGLGIDTTRLQGTLGQIL